MNSFRITEDGNLTVQYDKEAKSVKDQCHLIVDARDQVFMSRDVSSFGDCLLLIFLESMT